MARDILMEWSNNGTLLNSDEKIFYNYAEPTVNQTLRKHSKLAGINKHITYHSSRHTFATLLVVDGVDIYKISKYLGHKSVNMTQRYLKYDLSIARESARGIHTFS
jgi:site-specific recombinase XerD